MNNFIYCFLTAFVIIFPHRSLATPSKYTPKTESRSILVYDLTFKRLNYAKNINSVYPIASLTKLMTGIISLQSHQPDHEIIKITKSDRDILKHSASRLKVNSKLSRYSLLHIALMSSENRAASALSRHTPGGKTAFMKKMNQTALNYKMTRTHFHDPTGLSPSNVSTAHDLYLLVKHAVQYPVIRKFTTDKITSANTGQVIIIYKNSDGLINNPRWNIKLQKTGYTNEAGHCLILMTKIKHHDYIIVILGSHSKYGHYADAITLRNWLIRKKDN